MKINTVLIALMLLCLKSFGQVQELETFRKAITLFVQYDTDKAASATNSSERSKQLTANYETAFLDFIKHKDSKNLDNLKRNSIDNKSDYIIGDHNYFFNSLRREPRNKLLENNVNYQITFYGLYDYKLSNFVSFYIQPFLIDTFEYVIYYCKLNGKGTYYIKDVPGDKIVFQSTGLTSGAPVKKFTKIDNNHILIVEDLGDNGERALVVNTALSEWKAINAFYGKALDHATDPLKTTKTQHRIYLEFVETKTIHTHYGTSFLKKYEIDFDEQTKTISYKRFNRQENESNVIKAKWEHNQFKIDDYYIGQDLQDIAVPRPE